MAISTHNYTVDYRLTPDHAFLPKGTPSMFDFATQELADGYVGLVKFDGAIVYATEAFDDVAEAKKAARKAAVKAVGKLFDE